MDTLSNNKANKNNANRQRRSAPPRRRPDKLCYTVPEAAQLLGFSRNFGYELARRGEIPTIKFGGRIIVPKAAFDKMLEAVIKER